MVKGFARPITADDASRGKELHDDFMQAQKTLEAKREINTILRSKSVPDQAIAVGDLVEVYIRTSNAKCGTRKSSRSVLAFNQQTWTITVSASAGRNMEAALKNVCPALCSKSFEKLARGVREEMDASVEHLFALKQSESGNFVCQTRQSNENLF